MKAKTVFLNLIVGTIGALTTMLMPSASDAAEWGYLTTSVPAGKAILGCPFETESNHVDELLLLGDEGTGTLLWRYDLVKGEYRPGLTYAGANIGWVNVNTFDKTPRELFILPPGEGFFFDAPCPLNLLFVGKVSDLRIPMEICGNNNHSIKANPRPQDLFLGQIVAGCDGDLVYPWDENQQVFGSGVTYVTGLGWVDLGTFEPINNGAGPVVPVARGFFIQKQSCFCGP